MAKDKTNKKSLKLVISEFFFNIWSKVLNWYRVSKFGAIVQQIGWFIGYQLQVDNPSCKEDVQNVRKNKLVLKIISLITTVLLITCLILFQIFFV